MTIVVLGESSCTYLSDDVVDYLTIRNKPFYIQAAESYFSQSPLKIGGAHYYVAEGEAMTNIDIRTINCIASDDATTCHIVAGVGAISKMCILLHVDSVNICSNIPPLFGNLGLETETIDVFIVGGLTDSTSHSISQCILNELKRCHRLCRLHLLATCELNVDRRHNLDYPKCYGAMLSFNSFSHSIEFRPSISSVCSRGPEAILRRCRQISIHDSGFFVLLDGKVSMEIVIPYFKLSESAMSLQWLLSLPDSKFLLNWSTSPFVEPVHFVEIWREVIQLCSDGSFVSRRFESRSESHPKQNLRYVLQNLEWKEVV